MRAPALPRRRGPETDTTNGENIPSKKRLPPYRRRQLKHSLWLLGNRLAAIEDLLDGTPDGDVHDEGVCAHQIRSARITLDWAEYLLLADESEGA